MLLIDLHNLRSGNLQSPVDAFVLHELLRSTFRMEQVASINRHRLVIALDEAHRLGHDITFTRFMREGRKFGVAIIAASQRLEDLRPEILKNFGSKIIFHVRSKETRNAAAFIGADQKQDTSVHISQLPFGSAYVQIPENPFSTIIKMYSSE